MRKTDKPPINWPVSFIYSPTSIYVDVNANFLKNLLSSPNPADLNRISPTIEKMRVHPYLKILKITLDLDYKGPRPHPLADKEAFEGHVHRGLFASKAIPEKTELGEYVGEISFGEQESKGSRGVHCWHAKFHHFAINISSEKICNELAFANDYRGLSEAPNVATKWILNRGTYYFGFETLRKIEAGEEILVDYGLTWSKKRSLPKGDWAQAQSTV